MRASSGACVYYEDVTNLLGWMDREHGYIRHLATGLAWQIPFYREQWGDVGVAFHMSRFNPSDQDV